MILGILGPAVPVGTRFYVYGCRFLQQSSSGGLLASERAPFLLRAKVMNDIAREG